MKRVINGETAKKINPIEEIKNIPRGINENETIPKRKAIFASCSMVVQRILLNFLLFPHDARYFGDWTVDNYGPIVIPKKGETVPLKKETIALYRRIINSYEGNTLKETRDGKFIINGKEATEYTFKQDYYWGMGDNRHASEDCRYFGFIPENHIVGKPLFIWFSTKNGNMRNGINWGRIFSGAYKM